MLPSLIKIKGVHPGAIIKRELKKQNLKSIELANSINEYPQTINAVTQERRGINPKLSIKLGEYFKVSPDYFMLLQASYDVMDLLSQNIENSILGKFRESLFWDTSIEKIDSIKHKRAIIQRVLERGNKEEIEELVSYYGLAEIRKEIQKIGASFIPQYEINVRNYILK